MDGWILSSFPLPPHSSALLPVWAGCCVAQTSRITEEKTSYKVGMNLKRVKTMFSSIVIIRFCQKKSS